MTYYNGTKLFFIISALMLFMPFNGQAIGNGIEEMQTGTITVDGSTFNFEKGWHRLVVSDKDGKIVFQWKTEHNHTRLRGFDYSRKNQGFVVILEVFDVKKKTYSLICEGPSFEENVHADVQEPFRDAVYFELEDGSEWIVFLRKVSTVSYYSFASKRLLAIQRYRNPVEGIAKDEIGGENFIILEQSEKGNITRFYKQQFTGLRPYSTPLLPMKNK